MLNTPESITSQLWAERAAFPNLHDDEFSSEQALLVDVKRELRAIKSFKDIDEARSYYRTLNDDE